MPSWKGRFLGVLVMLMLSGFMAPVPVFAYSQDMHHGQFVDKIVYNVITQDDQQVLALQDDYVDLIGETLNPTYMMMLEQSENIDVVGKPRNGYFYLNINTEKYPFNITAFRRAFALALDKERICSEVWAGLAIPQDSPIPLGNPYSAEGEIGYNYYDADNATANLLLDNAGFLNVDEDEFRESPNGADLHVLIEVPDSSEIAIGIGEIFEDALHTLDIDATCAPTDFYEYLNRLYFHGDFDTVLLTSDFENFDVTWLAYEYWSEYADEPFWNFPHWRNSSFDYWRDFLLHGTTFEEVYQAAFEMQKIWIYECPAIVIGQNEYLSAYRTDRFEGFVNSVQSGVPGWWTNYKVHLKEEMGGSYGGTFRWSSGLDIESFNFMVTTSEYSQNVLMELYDSLMKQDPEGNDILWLAESFYVNTHEDNPSVPEGHTQFAFNIFQNITWTDNTPLTGEDVAFSLNYYRDAPGNPLGFDLSEMTAAFAPTMFEVIVEFESESFWHLHTVSYKPIIPKHIFQDIGLEGWNIWNPDPPDVPMVTSGPYNVSDYVMGECIELTYNPNYLFISWNPNEPRPEQIPITTTGNPAPPGTLPFVPPTISPLDLAITIPSIIVIAVVLIKWKKDGSDVNY